MPGDTDPACAEPVAEVPDRARPERDVDERVALEDPLALRLRVAAADGDDSVWTAALERCGIARDARPGADPASRGSCRC